jgi:formylglycine-generating enzyme required for sulfatase activity
LCIVIGCQRVQFMISSMQPISLKLHSMLTLLVLLSSLALCPDILPSVHAGVLPKDSAEQYELTFWDSIKNSQQADDYQAYLQAYPKGRFAGLARSRIERLRSAGGRPTSPSTAGSSSGLQPGSSPGSQAPAPGAPQGPSSGTSPSSAPTPANPSTPASPSASTPRSAAHATTRPALSPAHKSTAEGDTPATGGSQPPGTATESGHGNASSAHRNSSRRSRATTKAPEYTPGLGALAPAETSTPTPASTPALPEVTQLRDCDVCPPLVVLPHGEFTMGSNSDDPTERPAFHVTIGNGFAIGQYETTVGQWNACMAAGGCQKVTEDGGRPVDSPVRDVSWDDAQAYVTWLSNMTGKRYRLPTEAEWEYAARGGTRSRYWWGEQMTTGKANCRDCGPPWSADAPAKIGSFAANPFGLYDMNGSVWEWVSDCWHASYQRAPFDGRTWDEPDCKVRVLRGGSWRDGAGYMPASTRFEYDASVRQFQNGFRVVRELP